MMMERDDGLDEELVGAADRFPYISSVLALFLVGLRLCGAGGGSADADKGDFDDDGS